MHQLLHPDGSSLTDARLTLSVCDAAYGTIPAVARVPPSSPPPPAATPTPVATPTMAPHAAPHAKPHAAPHTKPHAKPHTKPHAKPTVSVAQRPAACHWRSHMLLGTWRRVSLTHTKHELSCLLVS